MRRRDVITLLAGAAVAWPLTARAQRPKIPRIGIIDYTAMWEPFRQELRDLGYAEGRNILIEYRQAEGEPARLAEAAADLARLPVDVIVTFGTPATRAARQATTTIPIVFISIGDPVRTGIVASFARPGGNVTGNTILGPDIVAKRLQLARELIPNISRLAFFWNPDNGSNVAQWEEVQVAAPALGMRLVSVMVRSSEEFDGALAAMMKERPDAFAMTNDPFHQLHVGRIIGFLARHRLPGMYQTRDNVVAGGLMSYGASLPDLFRRGSGYVHKVLQGANPAELPIEQPTKFELVINMKTAKALGLAIAESFLLRADEVIE